jgi:ubiquinone/menaquinone biosynthesis C-methylase UbiE
MQPTNYERIAARYDENEVRKRISPDDALAERLARSRPLHVLDVACGTGNWLAVQTAAFGTADVQWQGLDASPAMLEKASTKLAEAATLTLGSADALPFGDGSFDFVACTFALHHFPDKPRALGEMRRVLRDSSVLRLRDVDPTRMNGSWVYRWFPETRRHDERRFWSPELVAHELVERGFQVDVTIETHLRYAALSELVTNAERRDFSQLADLSDSTYERGLSSMRAAIEREPQLRVFDEVAIATWTARR